MTSSAITLSQGKRAIVDTDRVDMLTREGSKWYAVWDVKMKSYYAVRKIPHPTSKTTRQYQQRMHRLILGLQCGDKRQGDHINGDTLDNRRSNLRIVTTSRGNNQNRDLHRAGRLPGCCFHKASRKWVARILQFGKRQSLGYYDTEIQANAAYMKAVGKL
jgi:hypothetical protein